jgi:hypothetical protein
VLRLAFIISLGVVIAGGALLWALPAMIRRVAIDQISRRSDRAATIENIRLNPFTGRLSVTELRLAEREGAEPFLELPRLEMRLVASALLRLDIRLAELALVAPSVRVVRTKSGEFNVSDLLPAAAAPPRKASEASAGRWTVTVGRFNGPGVVAAYFAERFPQMAPPATVEKQLALLREREPAPEGPLSDLSRRRVDATRERLTSVEGIPAERLAMGAPKSDAATPEGGGRVEIAVIAGDE